MKKSIYRFLPVLLVATLAFAGCAKQQVIKKDEPLPTSVTRNETPATSSQVSPPLPSEKNDKAAKGAPTQQQGVGMTQQDLAAQPVKADLEKTLNKVYFNLDSYALDDAARSVLTKNLEILQKDPLRKIRIEGHCDERGSDEYNLALGERRAQAAARYLSALGVAPERLSVISYGKEKPADPGHDEKAWRLNRRDEFIVQ
ncbi:peptidoglycan-associated lipoprotein Pal [Geomonas sp. RF6]|uniref:peptidoglycan-associated lipoprotein Pal n=1 Tax=Geomonas sp. RF6 TaxID=2897342 RepID=UPI001E2A37BF|nr:peptidoglycan-associated lipoprotein Pal [Geomonas sp. RF6]UFS69991.1 peptidoglycan-associated lipoprotein Pal [Geomonas sp. RF6]